MTDAPQPTGLEREAVDRLDELIVAVNRAADKLVADREGAELERAAFNGRIRWNKRVAIIGVCVGLIGAISGPLAYKATIDTRHTRDDSRAITCRADNDAARKVNALNDGTQGLVRAAIGPVVVDPARSEAQRAQARVFLDQQIRAFEAIKVEVRDCSPEGIKKFYDG